MVGDLLRARVRLHGIQLGRPVDLILDQEQRRALGFEVHCGDDERRFLPFAVARFADDTLAITSSLLLLDGSELSFYTERGFTFASLRQTPVHRDGRLLGTLEDVRLSAGGEIEALVARTENGPFEVMYDDRITLGPARIRPGSQPGS